MNLPVTRCCAPVQVRHPTQARRKVALARQELGQLAATPLFAWDFQFQLPTSPYCLRVLTLNDDPAMGDPGDDFVVEGRVLLTDESSAKIKYIKRITDPAEFDFMLYEALIRRMAAKMGRGLPGLSAMAVSSRSL